MNLDVRIRSSNLSSVILRRVEMSPYPGEASSLLAVVTSQAADLTSSGVTGTSTGLTLSTTSDKKAVIIRKQTSYKPSHRRENLLIQAAPRSTSLRRHVLWHNLDDSVFLSRSQRKPAIWWRETRRSEKVVLLLWRFSEGTRYGGNEVDPGDFV